MRVTVLALALSVFVSVLPVSAQAVMTHYRLNIPRQPLDTALDDFAHQTGLQVARFSDRIDGSAVVGPVSGQLSADEALKSLLGPQGLSYKMVNERTVVVLKPGAESPAATRSSESAGQGTDDKTTNKEGTGSKSFSDRFRVAQADQATAAGASSVGNDTRSTSPRDFPQKVLLEEVLVTAEKREERLRDVPVPVTAISGDSLASNDQVRIQDYALTVPGLSVSGQNGFYQTLSIRGITTGTANPTVGIMLDDVPFGSSSIDGGGLFVPDFDPGDLARVEVLRGPQGTLYGASSMGGLLKFVTIDPSTSELSGRVSAGTSSVSNGAKPGYSARGSVNVPLSDTWAIRLSGFTREDPGYIDNPFLGRKDVNKTAADGGRLSALWRPFDMFSLKLSALYQEVKRDGDNNVEIAPGFGTYEQSEISGAGSSDMKVQVYSATATAKLGTAELTAISGYTVNGSQYSQDYSAIIDSGQQFSVSGTRLDLNMRNAKFTQEIRIAMPLGTLADWLLGGFYSHERTTYGQNLYAEDPMTGQIAGQWVFFSVPQAYTEVAGFTDLTFHLNDRFDVQLGARDSNIRQASSETQIGQPYADLIGSANPLVYPRIDSNVNAVTYLLTPRFKVSPELMVYARLASGYRPGGPNVAPGVPPEYQPDKTQNYELGVKGDVFERRLTFDGSLYYIDWKNIQLTLLDPQTYQGYAANASRAKSQGIELAVSATPVAGLTTAAWVAWNTAVLKQGFPYSGMLFEAFGAPGDRLPFGSRFSGNVSVNYEFHLLSNVTASVGAIESYVGNQVGGFQDATNPGVAPPRQFYPSYARTDLRAGIEYDTWSVNLFANNVTNKMAIVPLGGLDASPLPPNYFTVLQPRLIGLNITKTF